MPKWDKNKSVSVVKYKTQNLKCQNPSHPPCGAFFEKRTAPPCHLIYGWSLMIYVEIGGSLYAAFHLPKYQFHFLFWVFSMTLFQLGCEMVRWKSMWTDEFTQSAGVNAVWYIRIVLSSIGMGNALYFGRKIHSMNTRLQPVTFHGQITWVKFFTR